MKSRTTIPFRNKKFTITVRFSGLNKELVRSIQLKIDMYFLANLTHKSNISCGISEPSAHSTLVNCINSEFKKVLAEKTFKLYSGFVSSKKKLSHQGNKNWIVHFLAVAFIFLRITVNTDNHTLETYSNRAKASQNSCSDHKEQALLADVIAETCKALV